MSNWKCETVSGIREEARRPHLSSSEVLPILHYGEWLGLTIAAEDNPIFIATREDRVLHTCSNIAGPKAYEIKSNYQFEDSVREVHFSKEGKVIKEFLDHGATVTRKTGYRSEKIDNMVRWVWEVASAANLYTDTYLLSSKGEIFDTIGSIGVGAFLYIGAKGLDSLALSLLTAEQAMSVAQFKVFRDVAPEFEIRDVIKDSLTPVYLETILEKVIAILGGK